MNKHVRGGGFWGAWLKGRAYAGVFCAVFTLAGVCSCGLLTDAMDEISSDEERHFLRVYSAVVFYSSGDEFNKKTDYKVEKVRYDGKVWRVSNDQTKCYVDGKLIDPSVPFYFWDRALVRVEMADDPKLFDEYIVVINKGGSDGGGGGGGQNGDGGGIIINWRD